MNTIALVTGGVRSGKSGFAQRLAESWSQRRGYVATGAAADDEMRERIARHRADRAGRGWRTMEEQLDIGSAVELLAGDGVGVVLVDCLAIWVSNLMAAAGSSPSALNEDRATELAEELAGRARAADVPVVFVTSEVGLGVVPAHPVARRYRDLLGRVNQAVAAAADRVTLMSCGLPLALKGEQ